MKVAPTEYDRPFPKLGITMEGIQSFIDRVGLDNLKGLTTTQVSPIVQNLTKEKQCSYCDNLIGSDTVTVANVFISHAWKYQFLNVVSALQNHYKNKTESETKRIVFWFDLFSNSQHGLDSGTPPPFSWWCNTFMSAIKNIGTVVMVLEPWNNPITLTRVWCLWEVYCASATGSKFEIAMSESETAVYRDQIVQDTGGFLRMLSNIDVRNSEAFNPLDKKQIFEVINKKVGFPKLIAMVLSTVRKWAVKDLLAHSVTVQKQNGVHSSMLPVARVYAALGEISVTADLAIAEKGEWLRQSYEWHNAILGPAHPSTLRCLRYLVKVDSKFYEKACESYKPFGEADVYYWDVVLSNHIDFKIEQVKSFMVHWDSLRIDENNVDIAAALVFRVVEALRLRKDEIKGLVNVVTKLKAYLPVKSVTALKLEVLLQTDSWKPDSMTFQTIKESVVRLEETLGPDHKDVHGAYGQGRDLAFNFNRTGYFFEFTYHHWYSSILLFEPYGLTLDPYLVCCIPCNMLRSQCSCCAGKDSRFIGIHYAPCMVLCCVPACCLALIQGCCCMNGFKEKELLY